MVFRRLFSGWLIALAGLAHAVALMLARAAAGRPATVATSDADPVMAALAERYPGAPAHWLAHVAERAARLADTGEAPLQMTSEPSDWTTFQASSTEPVARPRASVPEATGAATGEAAQGSVRSGPARAIGRPTFVQDVAVPSMAVLGNRSSEVWRRPETSRRRPRPIFVSVSDPAQRGEIPRPIPETAAREAAPDGSSIERLDVHAPASIRSQEGGAARASAPFREPLGSTAPRFDRVDPSPAEGVAAPPPEIPPFVTAATARVETAMTQHAALDEGASSRPVQAMTRPPADIAARTGSERTTPSRRAGRRSTGRTLFEAGFKAVTTHAVTTLDPAIGPKRRASVPSSTEAEPESAEVSVVVARGPAARTVRRTSAQAVDPWPGASWPAVEARDPARVMDDGPWPALPPRDPRPPGIAELPAPRLEQLSRDQEEGRWSA